MINRTCAILSGSVLAVSVSGCALVSDVQRVENGSEKHTVSVFGILPIWHTERPVETEKLERE